MMKKGKFLTALLACSMSVVAATACAFTVGCKDKGNGNEGDGDNTGHTHQWATTLTNTDPENHWYACLAEGHTGAQKDVAPHNYDDEQDTTCNSCGYVRTVDPGQTGPGTENPPTPTTKDTVIVNAGTLSTGTISDGADIGTNSGLKALGDLGVDANSKKIVYKGEEISVANRIKLTKKITDKAATAIAVNVEADANIIVYNYSATSGSKRGLALYDSEKTLVANTSQIVSDGNVMGTAIFSVKANTQYYIGLIDSGVNIYYMAIVYGDIGETWEAHDAKAAECGVAGNIAYSVSNYGRYKKADGTAIMANEYSIAALEHSYTLKAGSITAPDETTEGSATLTCANGHETPVVLPVLSSDKYTTRPAAGATGTYTITISGVEISFEATGVAEQETQWTSVYTPDLSNLFYNGLGEENAVTGNGGKTYYTVNKDDNDNKTVNVDSGVVSVNGANLYFTLDNAVTSGVVKITGKVQVKSSNTGWTFLQLKNSDGQEIFGIRAEKNVGLAPRFFETLDTSKKVETYQNTVLDFEIIVDCTAKTLTCKLGSTVLADAVELSHASKATNVASLMLNVNTGRTVEISELAFEVPEA